MVDCVKACEDYLVKTGEMTVVAFKEWLSQFVVFYCCVFGKSGD
jgi:hypothetical protein